LEIVLIILLSILGLLFFTTLLNVLFWPKLQGGKPEIIGTVSILIPARNEEVNIVSCLESITSQQNIIEVLVYNDHSTDETGALVKSFRQTHPLVRLIEPIDLPAGWTGKNFACYQLASHAKGEWLLFADADARFSEGAVAGMLSEAVNRKASFVSCWPGLEMRSFWEKLLMPLLNFFVFSTYPAPISFKHDMPSLGIAHGACIMMNRDVYHKIGGHSRVSNQIFEDTQLARLWREEKERSLCFDGQNIVKVRMYETLGEIWLGFQKNFYPGFKSSLSFWLFIIMHASLFLIPFLLFYISQYLLFMAFSVWLMRILLALRFKHPVWSALLHPLSESLLLALAISSWWQCISGKGVLWKGRSYLAGS
jgi:chlorobactene glucosyltransferase